jgi:hypothetical protein
VAYHKKQLEKYESSATVQQAKKDHSLQVRLNWSLALVSA